MPSREGIIIEIVGMFMYFSKPFVKICRHQDNTLNYNRQIFSMTLYLMDRLCRSYYAFQRGHNNWIIDMLMYFLDLPRISARYQDNALNLKDYLVCYFRPLRAFRQFFLRQFSYLCCHPLFKEYPDNLLYFFDKSF